MTSGRVLDDATPGSSGEKKPAAGSLGPRVTDAGIAGRNEAPQEINIAAAPSTGTESNAVRAALTPVACLRLDDIRFEFDSSFVQPAINDEMKSLAELFEDHPPPSKAKSSGEGSPVSIFGHADPVGNDDYNKLLSGRRATAIYGLLTRDVDLWEDLFAHPHGNDKWGPNALRTMVNTVSGKESDNPDVTRFERDSAQRKVLYRQYMDKLCGPNVKLEKTDFLARGTDKGGKGDFQGCGEFNPSLVFSETQNRAFTQATDKTGRDAANAPNRRVMVLMFRPGTRVLSENWPCPRVKEGVAGCTKRLFSDGAQRRGRRLPDTARKYEKTQDTFACRFYDRLTNTSPCEGAVRLWVIRLVEDGPEPIDQRKPLANLPFAVTGVGAGVPELRGTTDSRGVLRIAVKDDPAVLTLTIAGHVFTVLAGSLKPLEEGAEGVAQRLRNLGFGVSDTRAVTGTSLIAGLDQFQRLHGLPVQQAPDSAFRKKLQEVHGS
jgi:outer membrane protein OmpA-like peptidoglycan-associated protein